MYLLFVFGSMFVLPVLSITAEAMTAAGADPVFLVGKWFVFWAGGVRLLVSGLSQFLRPALTARGIFGVRDRKAAKIVAELGSANVSIGLLCTITLAYPEWVLPAALVSGMVHALAGGAHAFNPARSGKETMTMASDLAMVVILGLYAVLESI